MRLQKFYKRLSHRPTRQTLRDKVGESCRDRWSILLLCLASTALICISSNALGQINDSLDSYPPRLNLASSDCNAEVTDQTNKPDGGIGDSGCESVTLKSGHGTEAILEYRIEPSRVLNELTALAHVRSSKTGQRIGLRIRFPYLLNKHNRQTVSTIVYGTEYREPGQWQKIGVGAIEAPLRLKVIALRREHGAQANLDDPYVDAVVINAYTGAGTTQITIDNISVEGLVAVTATASLFDKTQSSTRVPILEVERGPSVKFDLSVAMPSGRITRILEHNGEPLDWVRTLGFDAVLVNKPPNERILREAMLARVKVFAPPPTAPDMALESLLEPLAGYYLGTSMNEASVGSTAATVDRLRKFPVRWQRPIIIAPAESWHSYAGLADSIVHDLPPPTRGLAADEEIASLADRTARLGRVLPQTIGIQTDPPKALAQQLDSISGSIGAPRCDDVPWHATQLQVARALQSTPRAILFRSSRSLTSGLSEDQRRSMGLSYINRYLETVGQLVAGSTTSDSLPCAGSRYRCGRLEFPGGQLIVASSYAQQRGLVLAGDGDNLQITLPPDDAIKLAWRITHFSAERVNVQSSPQGPQLEIVSPDTVETIIISSDPEMGGRIAAVVKRVASQASLDRWQLAREALNQLSADWSTASASRIVSVNRESINLINAAESTLRDAEPVFRSGDASSAIRMARRADAWQLKARWNLHSALSPGGLLAPMISAPPLLSTGGVAIQLMWWPLMSDRSWSENRLSGGSLDDGSMIGPYGWSFGRRNENETIADVRIESGRQAEGSGCLFATVASATTNALPGGYAGTAMQIRSPSVRFGCGVPVRIDARMRTLGFGGPDQGVLVFDTIGGPELGVLVRATPAWQNVRLYRQTIAEGEVQVLFEAIGAGEVMIDDVQVRAWEPATEQPITMRRIAENPN